MKMEAEIVDFESLPESASFWTHMTAGAIAGMAEHSIFYPVDTIKVRDDGWKITIYKT